MKHMQYIPVQGRRNTGFFLLFAAIAAGVVIGSVPAVAEAGQTSLWLHQCLTPLLCGGTVLEVLGRSLLSSFLFLSAVFLLGLFAFGQPLGAALLVYRGTGIGISVSAIYSTGGLASLPAVFVLGLPVSLAVSFISALAVRELIRSSNGLLRFAVSGSSRDSERGGFRSYCIRFAVLFIFSFIISVAEALLSYVFAGLL